MIQPRMSPAGLCRYRSSASSTESPCIKGLPVSFSNQSGSKSFGLTHLTMICISGTCRKAASGVSNSLSRSAVQIFGYKVSTLKYSTLSRLICPKVVHSCCHCLRLLFARVSEGFPIVSSRTKTRICASRCSRIRHEDKLQFVRGLRK